jgi:RNA polymerase sigma-70 factor (ECF subfamily)
MTTTDDACVSRTTVEELFRKYYRVLRAYAYRLVGSHTAAEDIVQDVWYELCKKSSSLELGPAIKYYLFKSVYTKSLNHLTDRANRTSEYRESPTETKIQQIYIQSQLSEPENDLYINELTEIIQRLVDRMPPHCRTVYSLSRNCDMKNTEIARHLGILLVLP